MKITNEQRLSILDELQPERQQPGDITTGIAMDKWSVSQRTALTRLDKAFKAKRLTRVWGMLDTKRMGWIYRDVKK